MGLLETIIFTLCVLIIVAGVIYACFVVILLCYLSSKVGKNEVPTTRFEYDHHGNDGYHGDGAGYYGNQDGTVSAYEFNKADEKDVEKMEYSNDQSYIRL